MVSWDIMSLKGGGIMKTVHDLEELKSKQTIPFGSSYNFLIERLVDYLISKGNGKERVEAELKEWDDDAQRIIRSEVTKRVQSMLHTNNQSFL
jgi:hypothetical protein